MCGGSAQRNHVALCLRGPSSSRLGMTIRGRVMANRQRRDGSGTSSPLTRAEETCEHDGCRLRLQGKRPSFARRPKALPRARGRCHSVTLFRRRFSRRNRQRSLPGTGFAWGTKASWPGRGITLFSRWRVRALSWCAIRRVRCVDFIMFAVIEGLGCARRRVAIVRRSSVHITPGPMRLTAD